MNQIKNWGFLAITVIIGFMFAVQYKIIREPEIRDTRDVWELKVDIRNEQEKQAQLLGELTKLEEQLAKYRTEQQGSKEKVLKETLDELKKESGLTDITGRGVILKIEPLELGTLPQTNSGGIISPFLLKRLVNELNKYDAAHISINGNRIINSTVIRDINGVTKIDGSPIDTFPIEIRALSDDAGKLRDNIKVSQSAEELFIEDLSLTVSDVIPSLTIPAFRGDLTIQQMKPANKGKGGD
ncbi:MAG: DUF881 domain-containing protein [Bacillus sp. (in: firmicutes)]